MAARDDEVEERVEITSFDMEDFFYHLFSPKHPTKMLATKHWYPLTDILETDKGCVVRMELGGVSKDDISVTHEGEKLIIRGVRREKVPKNFKTYRQMEINYGLFERACIVPSEVKVNKITAHMKDGFLNIYIFEEKPRARAIKILVPKEAKEEKDGG